MFCRQPPTFSALKPRDFRVPGPQPMKHVAWSVDGKKLAAVGVDKVARVWNPDKSVRPSRYTFEKLELTPFLALQLDYRSAQIYSGGHSDDVDYISWNPTHPDLFCTSSSKDRRIVFWDARRASSLPPAKRLCPDVFLPLSFSLHRIPKYTEYPNQILCHRDTLLAQRARPHVHLCREHRQLPRFPKRRPRSKGNLATFSSHIRRQSRQERQTGSSYPLLLKRHFSNTSLLWFGRLARRTSHRLAFGVLQATALFPEHTAHTQSVS